MATLKGPARARAAMNSAVNILQNLLNPRLRPVMLQKVRRRFAGLVDSREERPVVHEGDPTFEDLCRSLDPALWEEAAAYAEELRLGARETLASLPLLGGGGNHGVLYFCVRFLRPEFIIETGVAAGFSSHALLSAMDRNGTGHLWSSDFPYVRLGSPERYVGVLVPERLRSRWTLSLEGDTVAVPAFLAEMPRVDLFHYDSDKSYAGRMETMGRVWPKLSPQAVAIVDDIQDNQQFADFVRERALDHRVFRFRNKRIGLILPGETSAQFNPLALTK